MPPDPPDAPTDAASQPVRADVATTGTEGGVLVAVTLRNDTAVGVRVRVENDLSGPVLPPRRGGVPAPGWDEGGYTGTVPANGRLGIGYACPVPDGGATEGSYSDSSPQAGPSPDSGPVSLETLGPAEGDDPSDADPVDAAVRSLGRAAPPPDAVPTSSGVDADDSTADPRRRRRDESVESVPSELPVPVVDWLDAVETRIGRAERLTDATADEAAAVLEDCDGVSGVATLPDDLERDLASLRAVGHRIEELATRAAETGSGPVVSSLVAAADEETTMGEGDAGEAATRSADSTTDSESGERR